MDLVKEWYSYLKPTYMASKPTSATTIMWKDTIPLQPPNNSNYIPVN